MGLHDYLRSSFLQPTHTPTGPARGIYQWPGLTQHWVWWLDGYFSEQRAIQRLRHPQWRCQCPVHVPPGCHMWMPEAQALTQEMDARPRGMWLSSLGQRIEGLQYHPLVLVSNSVLGPHT